MTHPDRDRERTALVALLRRRPDGMNWHEISQKVLERGSARAIWAELSEGALLGDPADEGLMAAAQADVGAWDNSEHRFVTLLDSDYPSRLLDVHQVPPFLFAAGTLVHDDRSICVVGSRRATAHGLEVSGAIARALAESGLTVASGLAEGIDTAAHTAALAAGGRTVAFIGTGITRYYPAVNRGLQERISRDGLVLSQFWPDGPPQRHNFLLRNAVMSGYGMATIVVEAGEHSGARAQARMAVEHGRPVILTSAVVAGNEWARSLVQRPGVHVAERLSEVMDIVATVVRQEDALSQTLAGFAGSVM